MQNNLTAIATENSLISAILEGIDDLTHNLSLLQFHAVSADRLRPDQRVVAVLELQKLVVDLQRAGERARNRLIDQSMDAIRL
jgi:hypothetical protein